MNEHEIEDIIGKKIVDWINDHAPLKVKALLGAIAFGILGFFLFMMAGCANICYHVEGKVYPYCGTVNCADMIATAFRSPRGPEGEINKTLAILFLPVWIVDLPLDVVADTVTLPYDLFEKKENDTWTE